MPSHLLIALSLAVAGPAPPTLTRTFTLDHGLRLELVAVSFQESAHKVERCQVLDWQGVCLIDGKLVFGTDWEVPVQRLRSATVHVGGRQISLDTSCMYNPQLGLRDAKDFSARAVEGGVSVRGKFSDGAGTYQAEWLVINGASVRTSLRNGEH
jgi:hypothetical protein